VFVAESKDVCATLHTQAAAPEPDVASEKHVVHVVLMPPETSIADG
jgi:hypothetical protein